MKNLILAVALMAITATAHAQTQEDCRLKVTFDGYSGGAYHLTIVNKGITRSFYVIYPDGYGLTPVSIKGATAAGPTTIKTSHAAPKFQQGLLYVIPTVRIKCSCPDVPIALTLTTANP